MQPPASLAAYVIVTHPEYANIPRAQIKADTIYLDHIAYRGIQQG